ncbi:hypothetical protein [Microvirga lenta]|uniref:hypothetical protein n=1 Tax=Microvirga lenta TaxID=2881337 RepID=UPI001CFDBB61|nr:hypothetical protein [Microvirga lenta]MCB5173718.1 hypothetical protein [Microvirga lenta]
MDQPYSAFADLLNKFHTSSDAIQALWLLAVPLTVLGTAYCVMRAIREIALAVIDRRGAWQGEPVYAIYRAPDGRWMLLSRGAVRELAHGDEAEREPYPSLTQH